MRALLVFLCAVAATLALGSAALAHPEPGDVDGDGVKNEVDNCYSERNADQRDTDGDGLGDRCDADADNDGVANASDNCPAKANADQKDDGSESGTAGNGIGDACDRDSDGDTFQDPDDNCFEVPNRDQRDNDLDASGDACDPDDDDDGIFDGRDNCPLVYNYEQFDEDRDGRGAACDADDGSAASGPAAGGGISPGAQADESPPKISVSLARRQRLASVEAGVVVRIHCSEACAATASLVADRRTARALRLPRSRIAARATAQLQGEATTYAFPRFSKAVTRRLWRRARTTLQLQIVAVDRAGNKRTVQRRFALVR